MVVNKHTYLEMINPKQTCWFPMRVTYGRELVIKAYLDKASIENFIPMHYEFIEIKGERVKKLVPAINNLIFVRHTQEKLTELKMYDRNFEPLRYMMRESIYDSTREIMTVGDEDMENFLKVAKEPTERVCFLSPSEYINNIGKKVKITQGPFAGVEGTIKRIKRNKHVVVQLEDIIAAAIDFVPKECLIEII